MGEMGVSKGKITPVTDHLSLIAKPPETIALERLALLANKISAGLDLSIVLTSGIEQAVELTGADGGTIALLDEETNEIFYPYHYKMPDSLASVRVPRRKGVAGIVIMTGEPVLLNDYSAEPAHLAPFTDAGVQAMLAVPLSFGGRRLGALGLFSKGPGRKFTQRDEKMALTTAGMASVTIENARLRRQLRSLGSRPGEADRSRKELIANMNHELRTELNSIIGFSKLVLDGLEGPVNEGQRRALEIVCSSGNNLLHFIDRLFS